MDEALVAVMQLLTFKRLVDMQNDEKASVIDDKHQSEQNIDSFVISKEKLIFNLYASKWMSVRRL